MINLTCSAPSAWSHISILSMKTPASLLLRLRQTSDQQAWEQFVELYTPIIWIWLRRQNVQPTDAADLLQEVFLVLFRKLPEFEYERDGSFRGWLRTIVMNKWRDHLRRRKPTHVESVDEIDAHRTRPDPAEEIIEKDYRERLIARALQLMKSDFQPTTWQAFWDVMVEEMPVEAAAKKHGISINAVYLAKGRILRRLRQDLDGFLES